MDEILRGHAGRWFASASAAICMGMAEPPKGEPQQPAATPPARSTPAAKPPPSPDTPDELERIRKDLERTNAPGRVFEPTTKDGVTQPKPEAKPAQPAAQLLPEGSFLPSRRGRMVRGAEQWLFVFDKDDQGRAEPPMPLLRCMHLDAMERMVQQRGASTTFTVSGQVYVYRGRNYFLVTTRPLTNVSEPLPASAPSPTTPPKQTIGDKPPAPANSDPLLERLIADLERESGGQRSVEPVTNAAKDPQAPRAKILPEGTFIAGRRGRVLKSGAGEWTFAFDNDHDNAGEPPMTLMPCLALGGMEAVASQRGESVTFSLSGTVFVHRDRNYILPVMYWVNRPGEGLIPTQ